MERSLRWCLGCETNNATTENLLACASRFPQSGALCVRENSVVGNNHIHRLCSFTGMSFGWAMFAGLVTIS